MAEETKSSDNLTKFPNAEKANSESSGGLPSAFDLFTPSVNVIKNNLVAFLILAAVPLILMLIGQGPHVFKGGADSGFFNTSNSNPFLDLVSTVGLIATLLAAPGIIVLQLKGVRKQAITWSEAFKEGLRHFWRLLGLILMLALILTVSLLLLIVPFFLVLPRVFLSPYFLIDKKLGVMDAIKASNEAYKAHKGSWGVIGVYVLLNLAGIIPVIGNVAANILSFLYGPAPAIRYEQIRLLSEGKLPKTPIEEKAAAAPAA